MAPRTAASTGDRVVFCSKSDCAFAGDEKTRSLEPVLTTDRRTTAYFECEADIIILDRRIKFGKVCARYARKTPA